MGWGDLFSFGRVDMIALHKTWFAFFLTFFVWFNMAPLVTVIVQESGFTMQQLKLLAITNVALTMPGRVLIGMLSDRLGPRRTFTIVMVLCAIPCFTFAFASSYTQMLVSRLLLSMVGTGFVVGIHMTALWFKPRDIGFAQGVEAGLGNWGSSIAAILLPIVALNVFGSWRYAIALSGLVMLLYGIYYWFAITDGPVGSVYHKPRKGAAIEVSTWGDMINAVLWTIPIIGVLAILVWRINGMGFMSSEAALIAYVVIAMVVLYQVIQILRFNTPILKKGVPEDDRYRFTDVGALCLCYVATFGAELGVISMLPTFFQKGWSLTPQLAGLFGSVFAFMNFFSRSLGGYISDRSPTRRGAMLVYLAGIAISFVLMGMMSSSWPLWLAVVVTIICAMFVTGGCGTTYALVPLVKRRITGQISGYVGAYGNVGAVMYLTVYTFVNDSQFFYFIGATVVATFLFCFFFLKEPVGAFSQEYQLSSVDREMMDGGGGH
ncbi:MAG TPA: MFS transporter [Deltaproteobacteria bacterium]|nr:MAG: MFS transporter [Deltaproteobacteria bacterium GWA2_55_82]OGQ65185.1 MAG: MFS transporter [Deltaproteobacteria bacterium RIFCSPLOWO2_02_FULL_55_12]OIJ75157.1 MAG: MFS transporter [Deltaproteobacteria bacterium GWC2_55_46]HBG45655.1 MFS transporter [Deltaproteobacteria bacterium]HCY12152.1 MFS transporter [Deltaproteobacteria bacterium]